MASIKIDSIFIDVKNRTIEARDEHGETIVFPGSAYDRVQIRWAKSSAAGLVIQSLIRSLENLYVEGGNVA